MALIKCTECEKEYSDKAEACPNCGYPTINSTIFEKRKNYEVFGEYIDEKIMKLGWKDYYQNVILMCLAVSIPIGFLDPILAMVLFPIVLIISVLVSTRLPIFKRKIEKIKKIFDFFQKRFPIVDKIPIHYSDSKVVLIKEEAHDRLMFKVYLEAYKFDADVIVINDSNVSTDVSGSISSNIIGKGSSGDIKSKNTFHITATLIRY